MGLVPNFAHNLLRNSIDTFLIQPLQGSASEACQFSREVRMGEVRTKPAL